MKDEKLFNYDGQEIKIINEFTYKKIVYVNYFIPNSYRDISVAEKKIFCKLEETYKYKTEQEIKKLRDKRQLYITEMQDEAVNALITRVKLNSFWGDVEGSWRLGLLITEQLKGLRINKNKKY